MSVKRTKPRYGAKLDPQHPLFNNIVGCWLLNEGGGQNAYDLTGNNDGTLTGNTVWTDEGVQCPTNGSTDRINLGSIPSTNPLNLSQTPEVSIVAIVNRGLNSAFNNTSPRVIDKSNGASTLNGWDISYSTTGTYYTFSVNQTTALITNALTDGPGFEILVATYHETDSSKRSYFVNGVDELSSSNNKTIPTTTTNASIGNWNHSTDRQWNAGEILAVYVFDKALTSAEALSISNDPYQILYPDEVISESKVITQPFLLDKKLNKPRYSAELKRDNILTRNLVGCYLLNEKGGQTAYDSTNNRHGTLTGNSEWTPEGIYFPTDAGTDRINLGSIYSSNALSFSSSNQCTIVALVDRPSNGSFNNQYPRIVDKSSGINALNGYCFNYNTIIDGYTLLVDGAIVVDSNVMSTSGGRELVVVTYHESQSALRKIYINGVDQTNSTDVSTFSTTTTSMCIGNWNHTNDRQWNAGDIKFVYLYDRVLSEIEIQALSYDPYQIFYPDEVISEFGTIPAPSVIVDGIYKYWTGSAWRIVNLASTHEADYDHTTLHSHAGDLNVKVVNIGDWDMSAATGTDSVSVAHGISSEEKIRSVSVMIRVDATGAVYDFMNTDNTGTGNQGLYVSSTNVVLLRATGGYFDNVNYDSTSFNRGWITIWYTD